LTPNCERALHKAGIEGDGFAEKLDAFLIAAVQHEEVAGGFVAAGVVRIPGLSASYPLSQSMVARMALLGRNGGRYVERLVGLFGGFGRVVIFERQARQQFLRFQQLGSASSALRASSAAPAPRKFRRDQRQAQQRVRPLGSISSASLKSLAGIVRLKVFQKQRPQRTRYSALRGCAPPAREKPSLASR
jgi:hypothetical protein